MKTRFDKWVDTLLEGFEELHDDFKEVRVVRANPWTVNKLIEGFATRDNEYLEEREDLPDLCHGLLWGAYLYEDDSCMDGEFFLDY